MFLGGTGLCSEIDRMVRASTTGTRPVMVVEGSGGSGRTALLEKIAENWQDRTPTALVRPRELGGDEGSAVRPVLAAVMLGLSTGAPGYEVSFPRVMLACIAMQEDDRGVDPGLTLDSLRTRINGYRDRTALTGIVRALLTDAGVLAANASVPEAAEFAPTVVNRVADGIVSRLQRSSRLARATWTDAVLNWFSHQGQGFRVDPELALLRLAAQAGSEDPDIRRDVDDLLVAALLADLRYSMANTANRPANALVLLDDGDTPAAVAFTAALVRVRKAIADVPGNPEGEQPDPLTMVTTSGSGALITALGREQPAAAHLDEVCPGAVPAAGSWVRVPSAKLAADNVVQLAKGLAWPAEVGTRRIAAPVYRLTRGHPMSTVYLLGRLQAEPSLADPLDIDGLLRRPGPGTDVLVEDHLLRPFVQALDVHKLADDASMEALITLSAARNRREANLLRGLLPSPIGFDSPLFTATTLWEKPDERLHPLVRYLGMRALANRKDEHPANWTAVFETLRAGADATGRLHHARLLGHHTEVADRLACLLGELAPDAWLALFDEVTATPDPRARDIGAICGAQVPATTAGHIARLLGVRPALDHDPCVTGPADRRALGGLAFYSFLQLAGAEGVPDPLPFILRAMSCRD